MANVFVNYSNHPYATWSQKQLDMAYTYADSLEEIAFYPVSAMHTPEEIAQIAQQELEKIMQYHPTVVMCQGEFTLTYQLVRLLKEKHIKVVAACSERKVEEGMEKGIYTKKVVFDFVQYREY